ncbi:hypothetical protein SAMN04488490_0912 [Marinobacter sp. LV10R510-11A]|nr:hypothetical protein SAMN04488490_0912 [Marinobacter sp. LV10R510-11A]
MNESVGEISKLNFCYLSVRYSQIHAIMGWICKLQFVEEYAKGEEVTNGHRNS